MNAGRLVKKAKKGNKEALLHLIMSEKDAYYKLALTYMGNTHDAMDAMDEMIVRVYEKLDQLKKPEAFHSWSKTILVNCCKSLLRERKRTIIMEDWTSSEGKETNPLIKSEQLMEIQELLVHLNEEQKEAVTLKYLHDFDYQTIAEITNTPIGTVKSRIFQGLKKLRKLFGGEDIG
ncbi:sigma-70 family RNA polymerase sigma factor [Metabacillus idriensis]|uniref:sigma-70 family RNA polymerase sigma factor n=1 Tax=Metabacillus idriensis TaxID=324768 RepID=UPI00174DBD88|nr:sigma-70 family RNA polymerase sigma factor [Metabacillus idriensis]